MKNRIKSEMVTAMKEKNVVSRDVLRVLLGEIQRNEQSGSGKVEISDSEVQKMIKKLIESIELSGEDNGEIAILEKYLPKQMSREKMIAEASMCIIQNKLTSPRDMGMVMGHFKSNFGGTYDGKELSEITKTLLNQ